MRALRWLALLLAAMPLAAQQLDLFDPDDFVDPRLTGKQVVFISRLVAGASRGYMDQFRRVEQDIGFVHLSNSLYWRGVQLDYKRTESRGEHGVEEDVDPRGARIARDEPAPEPGPKNLTQLSYYQTFGERLVLRYRLARATQFALPETAAQVRGLEDRDETRFAQLDTGVLLGTRMQFVTLTYTELTRHSTLAETQQRTLTASAYLLVTRLGRVTLAPRLQLGGVANDGPLLDIINPSLNLSMRIPRAGGYLHAIYSPVCRDGSVHHQIVVYADRALLVLAR